MMFNSKTWIKPALVLLLATALIDLVLIQPNHPAAMTWGALKLFPLELPAIILTCITLRRTAAQNVFRVLLTAILLVLFALKGADFIMFSTLNRAFNVVADVALVPSLYHLITGSFGTVAGIGAALLAPLIICAVAVALWWAIGVWLRVSPRGSFAWGTGIAALIITGLSIGDIGQKMGRWSFPYAGPGTAFTARIGVEKTQLATRTLSELRSFRQAAQNDPFTGRTNLFDLVDRDILIVFVESYGRTSIDTPLYADTHRATLTRAQSRLNDLGLSTASTLVASPTMGGQSWLAHATFSNGLWVDNQTAYRAVLSSGKQTLFHLAQTAGFHTAAVMPQITLDWPEADVMGFDTILAANDLEYQGKPLNWVTMPDQFTFASMDRLLAPQFEGDTRTMVQIATASSHAPWVPVPTLLEWESVGDGTVFDQLIENSDPPSVVWQDHDRVRSQYRLAVDYALEVIFDYAARHVDDPPLMIVIGDHQAAGLIALDERPHVPMHIIGPEHLVNALSDDGFSNGLIPDDINDIRPMADLQAHIVNALTSPSPEQTN